MPEDNTRWYAFSVIPRKEKVTSQTLRAKGYEEFLPLYTEKRPWSDRIKAVELPLFPGYVFCRLDPQVRLPILKIPSINQIIGFGKTPQPVEDAEIANLQAVCKAGIHAVPCPYLTAGARVNILEGPLKGVEGILVQDAVQASDPRLIVSVTLLQRSISVEINREWISPLRIYTEFAQK
jgi:transcription antitermination factor NusG